MNWLLRFSPAHRRIDKLSKEVARVRVYAEELQSRRDLPEEILDEFERDRASAAYAIPFEKSRPLVSVCVSTYNRPELLVDRCLKSILAQTYDNLEIVVVGDACETETEKAIASIRDTRLRFVNLAEQGIYPETPLYRWMVAGNKPKNHALQICEGDFVTHLDDDDEYFPERIEKLVELSVRERADIVWHPFLFQDSRSKWKLCKAETFSNGNVGTSSVFYHRWFNQVPWDIQAYRNKEPNDWNRFRKMRYIAAKCVRYPSPLVRLFEPQSRIKRSNPV